MQYFSDLSNQLLADCDGREIGRLTGFNRSRTISARSKSRSSADSFSECCFCKCAGCVTKNNSSTNDLSTPGNTPKSTPNRINDNRFIVSLEVIVCAFAKIPYARPMWL